MSAEDCTKQYTLRVIVNVGPNCFHFKYLDDKAFNFFFDQVSVCVVHVCVSCVMTLGVLVIKGKLSSHIKGHVQVTCDVNCAKKVNRFPQ